MLKRNKNGCISAEDNRSLDNLVNTDVIANVPADLLDEIEDMLNKMLVIVDKKKVK